MTDVAAPAMRLVLIRHAESRSMLEGVMAGHEGDRGLSEHGRIQAERLRYRVLRTRELATASRLYASRMRRAVETAEIIAPAVGADGLVVSADCGLCEIHPGAADGLHEREWVGRFGRPDWERDPEIHLAPGGESLLEFFRRSTEALQRLARAHPGETVVAVSHGGPIEAAMVAFLGLPFGYQRVGLDPECTSMTAWRFERANGHDQWRLERYNDAAHLLGPRPEAPR